MAFDCIVTVIVICFFIAVLLLSYFLHYLYDIYTYSWLLVYTLEAHKHKQVLVIHYTNFAEYYDITFYSTLLYGYIAITTVILYVFCFLLTPFTFSL